MAEYNAHIWQQTLRRCVGQGEGPSNVVSYNFASHQHVTDRFVAIFGFDRNSAVIRVAKYAN